MQIPALSIKNVSHNFGDFKALDKVSPATRDYGRRVAAMADSYASQLKSCRSLSWYNSWYKLNDKE